MSDDATEAPEDGLSDTASSIDEDWHDDEPLEDHRRDTRTPEQFVKAAREAPWPGTAPRLLSAELRTVIRRSSPTRHAFANSDGVRSENGSSAPRNCAQRRSALRRPSHRVCAIPSGNCTYH